MYKFEEEFRRDHPETVGEKDLTFDLDNYKDWLEKQLVLSKYKERLSYLTGILKYNIWADYVPNGNDICDRYEREKEDLKYQISKLT